MAQPADIYDQVALRLRAMVREEHVNSLSGVERFSVVSAVPLIIEHVDGDLVLEDGDPDFTVGVGVRSLVGAGSLHAGDQVWVLREGLEWHAVDVTGAS